MRTSSLFNLFSIPLFALGSVACASKSNVTTRRIPQFENDRVEVWRTVIAPKQPLKMHRHDFARVIVPITDTRLKVVQQSGETEIKDWRKGSAYWLPADPPGELHGDINESKEPMEVLVIQFKRGCEPK